MTIKFEVRESKPKTTKHASQMIEVKVTGDCEGEFRRSITNKKFIGVGNVEIGFLEGHEDLASEDMYLEALDDILLCILSFVEDHRASRQAL